jgi:hypothetical protein
LPGVRILLETEQGLGDEVFFLRFAPLLKERGASWLAYRCGHKLTSLLRRVPWLDQVIPAAEESHPTVDYHWPIGDLPFLLGINRVDQIPPPLALSALPELVSAMQTRLNTFGPPPYLGVTWWAGTRPEEANKRFKNQAMFYKNISLTDLSMVLRPLPATIIILQRHPTSEEIDTLEQLLGKPVYDCSLLNDNLEEMLALLSLLDDYIGVSNTNMYLRAGLGKTARVLVPHPSEWRWLAQGEESPWFPGFQVYRQTMQKDWSRALQQLRQDLIISFN